VNRDDVVENVALCCAHPQDVLCVLGSVHFTHFTLTRAHTSHTYDARYQYVTDVRNGSRGPLLAHGPWDAPSLHGKAWFIEDDTRTLLSTPPPSWCVILTVPHSVLLTVNTLCYSHCEHPFLHSGFSPMLSYFTFHCCRFLLLSLPA
jgi:hypothetical protein